MRLNGCDTSGSKNDSDTELKYNKCSLFIERDPIPLNRCSGIADFPLLPQHYVTHILKHAIC